jgi:hypothetical protein
MGSALVPETSSGSSRTVTRRRGLELELYVGTDGLDGNAVAGEGGDVATGFDAPSGGIGRWMVTVPPRLMVITSLRSDCGKREEGTGRDHE